MDANSKIIFKTVEEYISAFPQQQLELLTELRATIKQAAPEAIEVISYNMPAYKLHGMLLYYAAHKNHIGFYPGSIIVQEVFKEELSAYETSKGTVRFGIDKALPLDLISRIVAFRVMQNTEKAFLKTKKKKA